MNTSIFKRTKGIKIILRNIYVFHNITNEIRAGKGSFGNYQNGEQPNVHKKPPTCEDRDEPSGTNQVLIEERALTLEPKIDTVLYERKKSGSYLNYVRSGEQGRWLVVQDLNSAIIFTFLEPNARLTKRISYKIQYLETTEPRQNPPKTQYTINQWANSGDHKKVRSHNRS